ncbi:MAG: hypothetical protein JNL67_08820 [Planctomycetaceae bacterium]|nr:hypothetical protein [Planctomycetaceae bacterium]
MGIILPLLYAACYAGLLVVLTHRSGIGVGLVVYACSVGAGTGFGGWLLQRSEVGRVTWRNRVAGFCLPWTGWVGGGTLPSLLVKNWLAGLVFGVAVLWADQSNWFQVPITDSTNGTGNLASIQEWGLYVSTWTCWVVLAGAWLWMLRTFLTRSSNVLSVLSRERGIWFPILAPPLVIAASVTLRATGYPWWGLAVAAAPLLYVSFPVLLIIAVMLWHAITGKPMRWN